MIRVSFDGWYGFIDLLSDSIANYELRISYICNKIQMRKVCFEFYHFKAEETLKTDYNQVTWRSADLAGRMRSPLARAILVILMHKKSLENTANA